MKQSQKEALFGCCLGDISIQEVSKNSARFQICHSIHQKEYVMLKYNLFKNLCKTEPKEKGSKYPTFYFNTLSSRELYELLIPFKSGGIRGVPNNVSDLITPVSLSYWFCDDGTCSYVSISNRLKVRNSVITLCTDRYKVEDVYKLITMLEEKFGIKSTLKNSKSMGNRNRIYIGTANTQKFLDIVSPFIPQSMQYKIKRPYTLD